MGVEDLQSGLVGAAGVCVGEMGDGPVPSSCVRLLYNTRRTAGS